MAAVAELPVDREGLPVTCTNLEALPVYNEMLLVNMAVRESALSLVQSVLEIDPGFILAHCVLVRAWPAVCNSHCWLLLLRVACGCLNSSLPLTQRV